jgi:hypothetical protein
MNLSKLHLPFTIPNWFINAFLIVDSLFVFLIVITLPKTPTERAFLVELDFPLSLFVMCIVVIVFLSNIWLKEPLYVPWSLSLAVALLYPIGVLEVLKQVYWSLTETGMTTEGERLKRLYIFLGGGAFWSAFLLFTYWLRIIFLTGIENLRNDMLIVIGITLIPLFVAFFIYIKITWMETPLSKKQAVWSVTISAITCFITAYQFVTFVPDWQMFYYEIMLILSIHVHIMVLGIFILRESHSRVVLVTKFAIDALVIIYLLLQVEANSANISKLIQWLEINSNSITEGFGWFLGAMASSAFFSLFVWRFGDGYRRYKKKQDVNTATLDDLIRTPGISCELARRLISNRPYSDYLEILERVDGVGPKRLAFLKDRFDIKAN